MGHGQMLRVSKDLRTRVCRVSRPSPQCMTSLQAGGREPGLYLVIIPPGMRGTPYVHASRPTALFIVSGEAEVWHGAGLTSRSAVRAGDLLCLPPGTPHLAVNRGDVTSIAVVARASPAADGDPGGTGNGARDVTPIAMPRHLAGLPGLPLAAGD